MPDTICQVLHSLNVGGAEVLAARLARRLSGRYRFVFACLDELGPLGRELVDEGFPVHVLGRRGGIDGCCLRRLAALLGREGVDLIHAHQYTPFFYASACRVLGLRRPPVLFTEHGRHHPDFPRRRRILANRFLLRPGDRAVAVGADVRGALVRNEGLPAPRVRVIHNGIPLERFEAAPAERDAARAELNLDSAAFVLVQVARLDYLKDHATAVRTMARVAAARPDAVHLLAGDGPLRSKIEAQVRSLGLDRHVRLLGARLDVPRLLAAADVALLTSISEGIPLTLIEAMAVGLPVVSTHVGGVSEVVVEGKTGLLAPASDAEALAGLVLKLAGDPARRHRMGQLGRARARALFSEPRMHAEYLDVYEEICRARSRVAARSRPRTRAALDSSPRMGVAALQTADE